MKRTGKAAWMGAAMAIAVPWIWSVTPPVASSGAGSDPATRGSGAVDPCQDVAGVPWIEAPAPAAGEARFAGVPWIERGAEAESDVRRAGVPWIEDDGRCRQRSAGTGAAIEAALEVGAEVTHELAVIRAVGGPSAGRRGSRLEAPG